MPETLIEIIDTKKPRLQMDSNLRTLDKCLKLAGTLEPDDVFYLIGRLRTMYDAKEVID